jgi:FkbM family methyltransferase
MTTSVPLDRVSHAEGDPWQQRFSLARRLQGLRDPRHLIAVLLKRSALSPLFTMTVDDGVKLRFFPSSLSTAIWEKRDRSGPDREFLKKYLKAGDTYVDVGANIGYLAITAANVVTAGGRVVAVEANPRVFRYLEHNIALNRITNVTAHHVAVGANEGMVDILECPGDDSQSCVAHGKAATPVRMARLDAILQHQEKIALLKIDVEGYEKFAIEGASGVLPRVGAIYFEYFAANYSRYNYSGSALLSHLQQAGFRIYRINEGHCRVVNADEPGASCENLVAVRNRQDFFSRTGYSEER